MNKTLKSQLTAYFKNHSDVWTHKGTLTASIEWFNKRGARYLPETVGKALRLLEADHLIAVHPDRYNKSIEYRWIPLHLRERYIPTSARTEKTKIWK